MTNSPLLLKEYFFTKIVVTTRKGPFAKDEVYPIQNRVNYTKTGKNGETAVCLSLRKGAESEETKSTYFFEVELVGIFALEKNVTDENIIRINAPSMLLGAAREQLYALTGRFPLRAFMLPSASFIDMKEATCAEPKRVERG